MNRILLQIHSFIYHYCFSTASDAWVFEVADTNCGKKTTEGEDIVNVAATNDTTEGEDTVKTGNSADIVDGKAAGDNLSIPFGIGSMAVERVKIIIVELQSSCNRLNYQNGCYWKRRRTDNAAK